MSLNQIRRMFFAGLPDDIISLNVSLDDVKNTADITSSGKFRNDHVNLRGLSVADINALITIFQEVAKAIDEALVISFSVTKPSAINTFDGAVATVVAGGVSPYTYSWSSGETTADLTDIQSGTYTLTVTDFFGTQTIKAVEVLTA